MFFNISSMVSAFCRFRACASSGVSWRFCSTCWNSLACPGQFAGGAPRMPGSRAPTCGTGSGPCPPYPGEKPWPRRRPLRTGFLHGTTSTIVTLSSVKCGEGPCPTPRFGRRLTPQLAPSPPRRPCPRRLAVEDEQIPQGAVRLEGRW